MMSPCIGKKSVIHKYVYFNKWIQQQNVVKKTLFLFFSTKKYTIYK